MARTIESGHSGPLVSMSGAIGAPNLGRAIDSNFIAIGATQRQIISDNPKRIALYIYNNTGARCQLFTTPDNTGPIAWLNQDDYLLFNHDFPWCGAVWAVSTAAVGQVYTVEVSIQ